MTSLKPSRVALVTHTTDSGVWAVTRFLLQRLQASGRYKPEIVLLATSATDVHSVRLLRPVTWFRKLQPWALQCDDQTCWHVGAIFTEFEFQRYRPRTVLTDLLNRYDLVQVVAGFPAWAAAVARVRPPICLFAATTVHQERVALVQQARSWRRVYWQVMNPIVASIETRALKRVDCVFAESEYTRRLMAPHVQPDRLVLGLPGVDTDLFRPNGPLREDGCILSVGRLSDPRKNVRLLIDAYHRLRQQMPVVPRLVLAGSTAPPPDDWEHAKTLGLTDHIEVRVNLSPGELAALYRDAAMFVLSSDEEGLGVVILEAMASGLPVVSTDCGGPATAVLQGQTGLLTPVGDAKALAEALGCLLTNMPLRRRMGQAGRERAEPRLLIGCCGSSLSPQVR